MRNDRDLTWDHRGGDYYLILGGVFVILGLALLGAFLPIINTILTWTTIIAATILIISMLIGRWLRNRRIDAGYYDDHFRPSPMEREVPNHHRKGAP